MGVRKVTPEQVRSLYEAGLNGTEIARRLGVGQRTAYRNLWASGVQMRPSGGGVRPGNEGKNYPTAICPGHPRANAGISVRAHILAVETATGRTIPSKHPIHHINGDKCDNRPRNLVVCESHGYHSLLHLRARAIQVCGHADWRTCCFCKQWAPTSTLLRYPHRNTFHHRECFNLYFREYHRSMRDKQDEHT